MNAETLRKKLIKILPKDLKFSISYEMWIFRKELGNSVDCHIDLIDTYDIFQGKSFKECYDKLVTHFEQKKKKYKEQKPPRDK